MLDLDPVVQIELAAEAGFWGLGLRLGPQQAANHPMLDEWRRRASEWQLRLHDLEVIRIPADGSEPAEAPALFVAAERLGVGSVLVVSDHPDLHHTIDALGRLARRGLDHGVEVAFEYMAWTTPSTPSDALTVAEETGCRIVIDILHHHRVGATLIESEAIISSGKLAWLQLCDGPLAGPSAASADLSVDHRALIHEARHARLVPGEGEFDLRGYVSQLADGSVISVEVQADQHWLQFTPRQRVVELQQAAQAVLER